MSGACASTTQGGDLSWVVKVCGRDRQPLWAGNFFAPNRAAAKDAARRFVSLHFSDDTKIVCIAEGRIAISITGPEIPF